MSEILSQSDTVQQSAQFGLVVDAFRLILKRRTIPARCPKLLNYFYGPRQAEYRADIASIILERKCVKSGKECQWNNWYKLIIKTVDAPGNSIADKEVNAVEMIWNEILGPRSKQVKTGPRSKQVKTWGEHYNEFRAYCRDLTSQQLANVLADEWKRRTDNPGDECFDACYSAARDETNRRGE